MKQSSLDIVMNDVLDIIYTSDIDTLDKIELLMNVKKFFVDYNKNIGGVTNEKVKTIDFKKER